jgi:hypothetical protein
VSPNCYSSFIEVSVSGQIERKFVQLERKLLSELNSIKAMLTNERPISVKTTDYEYFSYDENLAEKSLGSAIDDDSIVSVTESVTRDSSWVRTEIDKFNNTVYTLKSEKVFTYYWEISQIRAIFRKQGIHIRSPDFYVLGRCALTSGLSSLDFCRSSVVLAIVPEPFALGLFGHPVETQQ